MLENNDDVSEQPAQTRREVSEQLSPAKSHLNAEKAGNHNGCRPFQVER